LHQGAPESAKFFENPRVLDWVDAQNAATLQRFNDSGVIGDRDVLKAIFDRPDNIPFPNRRGGKLFNPWQDAAHPRGVWRVTTLDSYRADSPDWDVCKGQQRARAAECQCER
jgi:prolyl oligopeptidase